MEIESSVLDTGQSTLLFKNNSILYILYTCTYIFSNMAIKSSLLAAASLIAYLPTSNGLATQMSGATYLKYAAATYNIVDTYDSSNFFSEFTLFSGADPTEGFVNYQGDQASASSAGLINTNNGQIYMGVDYTNVVSTSSAGRPSIRVSSNKGYTHGLFIADIAHMPGSICG